MRRFVLCVIVSVQALGIGVAPTAAQPRGAYVVVDIVGFSGPDCSAALIDISNQGDEVQPFGWTLTLTVPKLGISESYFGQQALAPGAELQSEIATGITEAGTYLVKISPDDVTGRSKSANSILRLPGGC